MIVKGIIQTIDFGGNICTVRLPYFENAGNDEEIVVNATFSILPGTYNGYKEQDVVFVEFEDNVFDKAVVTGKLYLGATKEGEEGRGAFNVANLTVDGTATIPITTKLSYPGNNESTVGVSGDLTSYSSIEDIIRNMQTQKSEIGSTMIKIIDDGNSLGARLTKVEEDNTVQETEIIANAEGIELAAKEIWEGGDTSKESYIRQNADAIENSVVHIDKNGETNGLSWHLDTDNWTLNKIKTGETTEILKANEDGLKITGTITATNGHIGKFIIGTEHSCTEISDNASGIYSDGYISKFEATPTTDGIYLGTDGIKLGENFLINTKGNIYSKGGTIGGFNITSNTLSAGSTDATAVGMSTDSTNMKAFWAGNTTPGSAPFYVGHNGALSATNATVKGIIKAETGYIGGEDGFIIKAEKIYNDKTAIDDSNDGIYIGTDGIALGKDSRFKVNTQGKLTASSISIDGDYYDGIEIHHSSDNIGNLDRVKLDKDGLAITYDVGNYISTWYRYDSASIYCVNSTKDWDNTYRIRVSTEDEDDVAGLKLGGGGAGFWNAKNGVYINSNGVVCDSKGYGFLTYVYALNALRIKVGCFIAEATSSGWITDKEFEADGVEKILGAVATHYHTNSNHANPYENINIKWSENKIYLTWYNHEGNFPKVSVIYIGY